MKPDQTPGANQDAGGIPVYPDSTTRPPRDPLDPRNLEPPAEWTTRPPRTHTHDLRIGAREYEPLMNRVRAWQVYCVICDEAGRIVLPEVAAPDAGLREVLALALHQSRRSNEDPEYDMDVARERIDRMLANPHLAALAAHPAPAPDYDGEGLSQSYNLHGAAGPAVDVVTGDSSLLAWGKHLLEGDDE